MANITREDIENLITSNRLELIPTQTKLSLPVINRIYKKMSGKIMFRHIKVKNGSICDGHHRYIASLLADYEIHHDPGETSNAATSWESVTFEEYDYDTADEVIALNKLDAAYNNISVELIFELIK